MIEIWKDVKHFEGLYQISNYGRLKSFRKYNEGYILSNQNKNGWYLTVNLFNDLGKRKTKRIHVLVAEAFIREIPKGHHVHHIDGNKQNNVVTNLQIVHPRVHRKITELELPQIVTGMTNYNKFKRPIHILQFDEDGNFLAEYANAQLAGQFTGVCSRNILQVARKEEYKPGLIRKQAGGYIWKLKEGD